MKILSSSKAGYQPNFTLLPIKALNIAHLISEILNSKITNPREGFLLNGMCLYKSSGTEKLILINTSYLFFKQFYRKRKKREKRKDIY